LRIKACSKNGKISIVHKNLLKRSYDRSKLPEESPKYRSRADQTLKKAPNPSKCRYRVITAIGEADESPIAPDENELSARGTESENDENDSAESDIESQISTEASEDAGSDEEPEERPNTVKDALISEFQQITEEAHYLAPTEVVKARGRPIGATKLAMKARKELCNANKGLNSNSRRSERIRDKALLNLN